MHPQIILTSEEHGCAYTMDSEGTLLYTPMFEGGGIETENDWIEVDHMSLLGEEESIRMEVSKIEEQLITLMKAIGWYYQK